MTPRELRRLASKSAAAGIDADPSSAPRPRRLVISVCPREPGIVSLAVERGQRPERLDAVTIATRLEEITARRGLADRVRVQRGCAGGCSAPGPNITVVFYAMPRPGERPDHVALGWKTYVGALDALPYLAAVIDENLRG